jgi:hypothetical protein
VSLCFIKQPDSSIDGLEIHPMQFAGAPAAIAASRTMRAASIVEAAALGCGEKMMQFLVLSAISALKSTVDVGFVVGMMPARIPSGSAYVAYPLILSSEIMSTVFSCLYLL